MTPNRYQPALLGGLFIGVLSSLPIVSGLNLCCCLWVVVGGLLTTYLKQQQQAEPVETGDAAIAGLLAGLIGAILTGVGAWVMTSWTSSLWQDSFRSALESNPQVTPEMRDLILRVTTGRNVLLIQIVAGTPIYVVFSMLGALLGLSFFRKKLPPPAPPMQV